MRPLFLTILTFAMLLPLQAAASDEMTEIRSQLMALLERVDKLEAENQGRDGIAEALRVGVGILTSRLR